MRARSVPRQSQLNGNFPRTFTKCTWIFTISYRQTQRDSERQRDRETERQRDRETERQRQRDRDRERDRERQRERKTTCRK